MILKNIKQLTGYAIASVVSVLTFSQFGLSGYLTYLAISLTTYVFCDWWWYGSYDKEMCYLTPMSKEVSQAILKAFAEKEKQDAAASVSPDITLLDMKGYTILNPEEFEF